MAKWGEGDPRWQVKEMGVDGKNVNAWHWEDKGYNKWGHEMLKSTWPGSKIVEGSGICIKISKVDKVNGDINAMRRKGKQMYLFDLSFSLKLKGSIGEEDIQGVLDINDVDNMQSFSDIDFALKLTKSPSDNVAKRSVRDAIKKEGLQTITKMLEQFQSELEEHHLRSMGGSVAKAPPPKVPVGSSGSKSDLTQFSKTTTSSTTTSSSSSTSKRTKKVTSTVEFFGPIQEVFACLTNEQRLSAYTQSQATFELKEGGQISLFGNSVSGNVKEVDPPKKIVMSWRMQDWADNHESTVSISLEDVNGRSTIVSLVHSGVPADDVQRTMTGWRERFWDRIKMVFGFGYKKVDK